IKRERDNIEQIELVKNPDIAATFGESKRYGQLLIGFALETDNAKANAVDKLHRKNLDMIVLNTLADSGAGFGTDTNKVSLITLDETLDFPLKSKAEVAADILDFIQQL
ncbi:MAG: phosphopantothenoylcysteine decarboxylase, partial [Muribaculaceae bacterium]|nr:phosphopantothenoylcysteine decarboxylase [Muribaculaceae bacterium]